MTDNEERLSELLPYGEKKQRLAQARKIIKKFDVAAVPSFEQVQAWVFDSMAEATDGCTVEGDGRCKHGKPSWLKVLEIL